MQVAVERRPGSQVALTITVEPAVVQQQVDELFQKYARRVNIPGFRPGKAPRKLLEERVPQGALMEEAIERAIDQTYREALRQENLEPLERGEIADVKTDDEMGLTYTVVVAVRPEVSLPDYTEFAITHTATQVTDEQVEAEITRLRERSAEYAEITDAGVENGDYVTIDYAMQVDGEAYPDGDTTGYPLEVGSDTFFPELNDGLLGALPGETVTITTTYPAEYANAELAGKTASFAVTIQQLRRRVLPEASEAWVEFISGNMLHSLDELRERVQQNLQAMAAQSDREQIRGELIRQLVDGAELTLPDTMVDEEYAHLLDEQRARLARERLTLEQYAEMHGRSIADIETEQRLLARDLVRRSLVLQAVARQEGVSVTEEELNRLIRSMHPDARNDREARKRFEKDGHNLDHLASRLFHEKLLTLLESRAQVTIDGLADPVADGPEESPAADE
jgi:trigger factor